MMPRGQRSQQEHHERVVLGSHFALLVASINGSAPARDGPCEAMAEQCLDHDYPEIVRHKLCSFQPRHSTALSVLDQAFPEVVFGAISVADR